MAQTATAINAPAAPPEWQGCGPRKSIVVDFASGL